MSEWIDWTNVIACCALLETLFRVVSAMPRRSARPQRLALAWMAAIIGMQAYRSFSVDAPPVAWQTAVLLASAAACAVIWRRTILRAVHIAYPLEPPANPMRRKTDFMGFDDRPHHHHPAGGD